MDKKPYIFNTGYLETGNKNWPFKYDCFFIISPEKMYFFLTSSNANKEIVAGILGGGLGIAAFRGIKSIKDKETKVKDVKDYDIAEELPTELVNKVPKFNGMIVVSKPSISKLKYNSYSLSLFLKNGKWMNLVFGVFKGRQVQNYLLKTAWIH